MAYHMESFRAMKYIKVAYHGITRFLEMGYALKYHTNMQWYINMVSFRSMITKYHGITNGFRSRPTF